MKKFWNEFQAVRLRNKTIYWALNLSSAFLVGLLFSLPLSTDREKLNIIGISVFTCIVMTLLFGGYKQEKEKFDRKSLRNP